MDMSLEFSTATEADEFGRFLGERDKEALLFFWSHFERDKDHPSFVYTYVPEPRRRVFNATTPELTLLAKINVAYEDWRAKLHRL